MDPLAIGLATCKACGRKIIFATTENGASIPLDLVAPCYTVEGTKAVRSTARVSHFSTYSNPNQFSGSRRKE